MRVTVAGPNLSPALILGVYVPAFEAYVLALTTRFRDEPVLNRTSTGMNYLGFRFHPGWVGLAPRSRRRLRERIRTYERLWVEGKITELELQQRAIAALAFAEPALTRRMGKRLSTIDY